MSGLLGMDRKRTKGLLSGLSTGMKRPAATPEDEAMAARYQSRQSLLSSAPQAQPPASVMGLGESALGFLLGGTEGVHQTRERRRAEAVRPQQNAQMQAIAQTIQDPRELALFLADPESWAKNVGEQFAPQVVAPGAGQFIGGRMTGEMPSFTESGDTVLRRDSQGITPAFTRTTPSIAEQTAQSNASTQRFEAENPVIPQGSTWARPDGSTRTQGYIAPITLSPGQRAANPQTGALIATGAPQVFSAGEGVDLATADGQRVYSNDRAPDAAASQASQATIRSLESDVFPVLDRQEQLLQSGDVITGFGGDARLVAARAAAALGDPNATRQVAATEEYIANAGRLRVGMARSLGANPSNADIQLLETVTAGNINASREGLSATIAQGRALAERQRNAARGAAGQSGAQTVRTPQEAAALPPGTRYRTPDGQEFIR
jgi:hypothetical protein